MDKNWRAYMKWMLQYYHIKHSGYKRLMEILHETDYIEDDEARESDGVRNRFIYLKKEEVVDDLIFQERKCSCLEMLIGFADKMNWRTGDPSPNRCFWTFMRNLGLLYMTDDVFKYEKDVPVYVTCVLERWMKHEFMVNGWGGLFPLFTVSSTHMYQKGCKNWEQMNKYLSEGTPPYRKYDFVN